jgi:hypothetical protein
MRRAAADKANAEELGVKEMVKTIYSAMITPAPTIFNKNPAPGLIDRIESIDTRVAKHDILISDLMSAVKTVAHAAATEVQAQATERDRVQKRDAV